MRKLEGGRSRSHFITEASKENLQAKKRKTRKLFIFKREGETIKLDIQY